MKDTGNKEKLGVEALGNVTGGTGDSAEHLEKLVETAIKNIMQDNTDVSIQEKCACSSEPLFPHSKKVTGKLYRP